MNSTKYDVFISYRRSTGSDDARLLQQALKARGYEVFFDYDSLRNGQFDQRIFSAIDEAPVFVLLLSEGVLDRCADATDWVRMEIEHALGKNRRIVPVLPSNQTFSVPSDLPESLRSVAMEQASELNKGQLFEESVDKIVRDRFPDDLKGKKIPESTGKKIHESGIPSTVRTPSSVFVGRETELGKLHELLSAGKIPVVTGPGGAGKSELVFQYAARFRADYPGGLFQIDAETARNWDEAYLRMLSQRSQPGVDVRRVLCIYKGREGGEEPRADDVVAALRRRSESAGRILLVLDNVESPCSFFDEETLRLDAKLPLGVSAVATARNADKFEPGERTIVFPLPRLDSNSARELLCQGQLPGSDAERTAAKDIVERLGRLPLYICRVRALLRKRNGRPPFAGSYSALSAKLRESLPETVDAAMLREEDKRRTPDALWKLTREALSADTSGAAWIKLAHIASFFSPDGIEEAVLAYLWQRLAFPGTDNGRAPRGTVFQFGGRLFDEALDVLRWHWILPNHCDCFEDDRFQMHRLTIDALRRSARENDPGLEESIGKTLVGFLVPSQWVQFAESEVIVSFIPDRDLYDAADDSVFLQAHLLRSNPSLQNLCQWERFRGSDWGSILEAQPQFAERCPWDRLNGRDWSRLLEMQPQFADRCSWDRLNGGDWSRLLETQPQFADRCPWDSLNGGDWSRLLEKQPRFADHCNAWNKLNGADWASLLVQRPQFADHCEWRKLEGFDWIELLLEQPQFADHCSWKKLDGSLWSRLLGGRARYSRYCRGDFIRTIRCVALNLKETSQPQFAERCPWEKMDGYDWAGLVSRQPQYADQCPWEKLDGDDWALVLSKQPQFADLCPWQKLDGNNWAELLGGDVSNINHRPCRPQFAEKCSWEKLNGRNWTYLILQQPQFAQHCAWQNAWQKLDGDDWAALLCTQPELACHCAWEKLREDDWTRLLAVQPQFADKRPHQPGENRT